MNNPEDTIAAIATAPGEAGIAVIRISGPDALKTADRIVQCHGEKPSLRPAGQFFHARIVHDDQGRTEADEVIVLIYRAPHSYTREDVVEIQGHGGHMAAQRVLKSIVSAGPRIAEPGEFTKRAFLNGRIDLVQAEAVADLIRARSDRAATAALRQLEGDLSGSLSAIYNDIVAAAADLEASLDFDQDDIVHDVVSRARQRMSGTSGACRTLLSTWQEGHVLRDGASVVIAGRPNAGKSTLMNLLLARRRAIVAETPGTTRDTIEEQCIVEGFPVRLTDTAGLRSTSCKVEEEGVARSLEAMKNADVIIYMVDSSQQTDPEEIIRIRSEYSATIIVVMNKTDLGLVATPPTLAGGEVVMCSLINGTGLDLVRSALLRSLHLSSGREPVAVVSERHRRRLVDAAESISLAESELSLKGDEGIVTATISLRQAAEAIGELLGKTYTGDLLDSIFAHFCIGK